MRLQVTVFERFDPYLFMKRRQLWDLSDGRHLLSAIGKSETSHLLVFEKRGAVSCYVVWSFVVHGFRGGGVVVVVAVMMVVLNGVPEHVMATV